MGRRKLVFFTPTQVSGLVAWFKADALGLTDGTSVASWTDSSGNSNTATQATGASQPIFKTNIINGNPVVRFNGGKELQIANEPNFDIATYTILFVATGSSGDLIAKNTTAFGNGRRRKLQVSFDSSNFYLSSGADGQSIGIPATTSNFNICGVITRGNSDHDLLLNGNVTNTTTTLADDTFNSVLLEMGAAFHNGAEGYTGDVAELIIYNVPLTSDQSIGVQNYLGAKYNISGVNLGGTARKPVGLTRGNTLGRVHI